MDSVPSNKPEEIPDLYHRPHRLMRVATWANILSWVVLVIAGLFLVFFVSAITVTLSSSASRGVIDLIPTLIQAFLILVPGLFLFVCLQAIAESIYILMDIEENTRKE